LPVGFNRKGTLLAFDDDTGEMELITKVSAFTPFLEAAQVSADAAAASATSAAASSTSANQAAQTAAASAVANVESALLTSQAAAAASEAAAAASEAAAEASVVAIAGLSGASYPDGIARLTVYPTNAVDNGVLYTANASGSAGNAISVAYAAPAMQATTVAVSTNAITVTPGAKARMVVGGVITNSGGTPLIFVDLVESGTYAGKPAYVNPSTGFTHCYYVSVETGWVIYTLNFLNAFKSVSNVATPDLATGWVPLSGEMGTPTVTAGISSAAQVIAAVNASTPAAALVTASAVGTVTGAVAEMAATNLIGGGAGVTGTYVAQNYRNTLTGAWYHWTGSAWEDGGVTSASVESILTTLGVPTYADLTAANAALTIGKPFYNTALTKLDITTA
jgi:hypothetical protein